MATVRCNGCRREDGSLFVQGLQELARGLVGALIPKGGRGGSREEGGVVLFRLASALEEWDSFCDETEWSGEVKYGG